jgi:outer membrane protein OmpA-like peptidoglycan-associated protein
MKNSRMLSIGKRIFSPSLEQTPKARSSKNNFNFSMVGAKWMDVKILKNSSIIQTALIIRLFCLVPVFFLISPPLSGQQQEIEQPLKYLANVSLVPSKLRVVQDSIEFSLSGKLPVSSGVLAKQPGLKLWLRSAKDSLDLGPLELTKQGGVDAFQKSVNIPFLPWMEGAVLELQFFEGKNKVPTEKRILAKGIRALQLMVRMGQYELGESIPEVGRYDFQQKPLPSIPQTKTVYFQFAPGKSDWNPNLGNEEVRKQLVDFLNQNPEIISIQLTGLQSPEQAEGRNSQLGYRRAEVVLQKLLSFFPELDPQQIKTQSRWNNWFDFRILLADYEDLPEATKESYYKVLLSEESFLEKGIQLKSLPDFERVASRLYPKLRVVKVELTAKPYLGLNRAQRIRLQESLRPGGANRLSYAEWEKAALASQDLEEQASLFASMAKWYDQPGPLLNLAVVRMRQAQQLQDLGSREVLWTEAARLVEAASQSNPNPLILYNQGQLKVLQGEYWEAYKVLSEASVLAKGDASLASAIDLLRGALDIRRGDYKLSLLRFNVPQLRAEDFFNKGIALFLLGDYLGAGAAFESSVIQGRELGYGYYGLALLAMESGQFESARLYLEKASLYNPILKEKIRLDPAVGSLLDF